MNNPNILVIDDEVQIRKLLQITLESNEYRVLQAATAKEGMIVAASHPPDLILLDLGLPDDNGHHVLQQLREWYTKPIIILSVQSSEEDIVKALDNGANDYLVKPFKIDRINQTLERIRSLAVNITEQPIKQQIGNLNKALDKLIIKNKEGINFINMDDIILIQRENRSTAIYTTDEKYITSDSLSELEARLDSSIFFRSHKSYIINLLLIYKIYPYGRWTYVVKLKNTDQDALLTHERYEELQKIFEK